MHGIELLARRNRLAETGLKLSRLRGRGTEFDRLREYRREDEYRQIDWKATARQEQLVSREYVVERNQNILIVLDCGRSMCNELGGISHLDRALNAAIVLSYIALRQGDNVGFLAFSNRAERWVRPVRGAGAIQSIIRHTYDIAPRYEASDYSLMVEELRRRFPQTVAGRAADARPRRTAPGGHQPARAASFARRTWCWRHFCGTSRCSSGCRAFPKPMSTRSRSRRRPRWSMRKPGRSPN